MMSNFRDDKENDDFESPPNSVVHSASLLSGYQEATYSHTHSAQSARFKAQMREHAQRVAAAKLKKKQVMMSAKTQKCSPYTSARSSDQQSLTPNVCCNSKRC